MSEKTPRQFGAEAKALMGQYGQIEDRAVSSSEALEYHQEYADYYNEIASGNEVERLEGDTTSVEQARKLSQASLKRVADLQPRVDYWTERSVVYTEEAAKHYEQNAASYHDLGVLEAAMDGIHINTQKPKDAEEHPKNDEN